MNEFIKGNWKKEFRKLFLSSWTPATIMSAEDLKEAEDFIEKLLSEYKVKVIEAMPEEMTMKAAIKSNSDAGAGYTIAWNSYREEALNNIKEL